MGPCQPTAAILSLVLFAGLLTTSKATAAAALPTALATLLPAIHQLELSRLPRLAGVIRAAAAAAAAAAGAATTSPSSALDASLALYIRQQRPLLSAQDAQQLLLLNGRPAASRHADDAGISLTSGQRQLLGAGRHAASSPFSLSSDLTGSRLLSDFRPADLTADEAGTVSRSIYTRTAGTVPSGSNQLQGAAAAIDTTGLTTVTVDSSDVTSFIGPAGDSSPMQPDYRIVGGTAAPMNRFKWICSMRTSKDFHFCGCSLIAPGVVLTAAHCLSSSDPEYNLPWVEVGRLTLKGPNDTFAGNDFDRFRCEKSVVYPGWSMEVGLNDIALCILPGASRYTPVKLAAESTRVAENSVATVIGWGAQTEGGGSSDTLLQVDVEVESLTSCNATYGNKIRSSQLCAGMPEGNADACQGDSGGPLFIEGSVASNDLQIGIVSYGVGCGRPRIPGVYTDVRKYRRWIADRMLENGISYDPVTNLSSFSRPAAGSLLSSKPVAASSGTSTVTESNGGGAAAGGWQNLLGFLLG